MREGVWKALGAGMVAFATTSALTIPAEALERQAAAAVEIAKMEIAPVRALVEGARAG